MNILPKSLQKVIEEFSKLPGIGIKSASRLSFFLINQPKNVAEEFGNALLDLKKDLKICSKCFNITDQEPCKICDDTRRNKSIICVVEHPLDVLALEKTGEFNGVYHILGGAISPVDGIGPDDIRIKELIKRIGEEDITEVILATNPSLEGEATAMYIMKELKTQNSKLKTKITRIARGLPMGGDLEYADEITLSRALEGRKEY
jgi:recombination protein RecR